MVQNFKFLPLALALLTYSLTVSAQTFNADSANLELTKVNNRGMLVLGTWAAANLSTGIYGDLKNRGEAKYFHQMNWMWNTINGSIAALSAYSNHKRASEQMSENDVIESVSKLQKVFLVNAGLDMIYIGVGSALIARSRNDVFRSHQFSGYGKSLLMQGGFLMLFDLGMFAVNRKQEHNLSVGETAYLQVLPNGISLRF